MQVIAGHPNLDLILLDLNLPDRDGFSMLAELGERYPAILRFRWWCYPPSRTVTALFKALDLGALGFIPKSGQTEVMLKALELVFAGGTYIPPEILVHANPK